MLLAGPQQRRDNLHDSSIYLYFREQVLSLICISGKQLTLKNKSANKITQKKNRAKVATTQLQQKSNVILINRKVLNKFGLGSDFSTSLA